MKRFKLIIKGILLYTAILYFILFGMGIESIYEKGLFIQGIVALIALFLLCSKFINKEDIRVLSIK